MRSLLSEPPDISAFIDRYDLLLTRNFLDAATCHQLIQEGQASGSEPAKTYGRGDTGYIDDRVRKASRLNLPSTTVEYISHRLRNYKQTVEQHFRVSLNDFEEPQFLRYKVGDFFVAHQDGNTGLLQLTSDSERRVSVIVFLNGQGDEADVGTYAGGSVKFSDYRAEPQYREFLLPAAAGTLLAFRSELTHEVLTITRGHRYSIVSWYR